MFKIARAPLSILAAGIALQLTVAPTFATPLYWDPLKTGSAGWASGTWDQSGTVWSSAATGGTDAAWINGSDAVFAGTTSGTTGVTVTLGSAISVGNLTISTSAANIPYTINTAAGAALTVSGGINASYAAGTSNIGGNGGLILVGDQTINVGPATITGSGAGMNITTSISGSGLITKTGSGTLALSAANTFTGNLLVTGGLLAINSDASLGVDPSTFQANNITLDGGGLVLGVTYKTAVNFSDPGNVTLNANRGITLGANGGTIRVGFADIFTVNGAVTGTGALAKIDSGTLVLAADNTYQGATSIIGTLQLGIGGTTGSINSAPITFGTGSNNFLKINRSDDVTLNNNIVTNATSTSRANITSLGGGTVTLNGAITGIGELWIHGTGTVIVNANAGSNRASSNVIESGFLQVSDLTRDTTSALGSGNIYIGQSTTPTTGAGLRYTGASVSTAAIQNVQTPYGFLDITQGDTVFTTTNTIKGSDGSCVITKLGAGTWDVSGATDNTRLTIQLNAGTVILDKASTSSAHAVSGLIVNAGLVQLAGSGDDQLYDGTTVQMNGGTMDMNGHNDTIAILNSIGGNNGVITNNLAGTQSVLTISSNSDSLYTGKFQDGAGQVGLAKAGTGSLTLTGQNVLTGGVNLNNGRLIVSGRISGSVTNVNGGVLGGTGTVGNVTVLGGTVSPGANATGAALGTLTMGTLDLSGGGVYEGAISTSTLASSLASITGDLNVGFAGSLLNLVDVGSDTGDAVGTKFTLISYTGVWDGGTFNFGAIGSIDDGGQFTFGSNTFQLNYAALGADPNDHYVTLTVLSSVPEPASGGLLLGGVALLGCHRRRRKA